MDWTNHVLGPVERWPQSLRTTLNLVLNSRFPMFMAWGKDRTFLYNDAYIEILGKKHPWAFGRSFQDVWAEIWSDLEMLIFSVDRGEASYFENLGLIMNRNGFEEETFFTFSYSPIRTDDGSIGGLHCACVETTGKVLSERLAKKNQERMQASERELIDTLESMSDAFFSVDKDWRVTRVNSVHERTVRLPREAQLGKTVFELWFSSPEYENSVYVKSYRKAMNERVTVTFEDYYEPLKFWTEVRVYPKNDGGLAVFFTDITERKQHEANLAAERQKLATMIVESPSAIALMTGPNLVFEVVNRKWEELVSPREYIGRPYAEVYPELVGTPAHHSFLEIFETGIPFAAHEMKVAIADPDGLVSDRYFDYTNIRLMDRQGRPYGVYCHALDVTSRVLQRKAIEDAAEKLKESEHRFKIALKDIPFPVIIHAEDGEILFLNDRWAKITGYDPREITTIDAWLERAYREDREAVRAGIKTLYGQNKSTYDGEFNVRIKSGETRVWEFSSTPIGGGTDGRRIVLSTARDVTEHKENEAKRRLIESDLIVAKEEAERSNQLKSAFLANMSHEIRTPLGVMIGFADLMTDTEIDQIERQQFAATLKRNGEQLSILINDILDLSKVEAGYLKIEAVELSLRALIEDVISALDVKALGKGLSLESKISDDVPEVIVSDPTRVRQVLWNLVGNAIKFTERGRVRLVASRVDDVFRIDVEDTGIGIRAEDQDKLFKAFSQADESMTRRFGGTGLGLALSRRLAELLGGDLHLHESVPGRGSTFRFTLRCHSITKHHAPSQNHPLPAPRRDLGLLPLENMKVLLTEDSPDNQQIILSLLTKNGAAVEIANNGAEGVAKALHDDYDVILMDIQMPILDGYSATQRLRDEGYQKPIIALTAHAMNDVREKCMDVGCTNHLQKPIDPKQLIETVACYAHPR